MQNEFLTVTEVNTLIKSRLEGDYSLKNLSIKGEISNYKEYDRAVYFSLKEGNSSCISCVMWREYLNRVTFLPKNGDEVIVRGSVSVYVGRGQYQLTVYGMESYGQGQELLRLLELKKKLEAEGLFDPSKKKQIPHFPKTIGVIVGEGSAAEADIITNINRRWPVAELLIFNSLVQGKDAPASIIKALNATKKHDLDVLILARGGGSSEDLGAFNDEKLVRELATYEKPIIAAVGHEIDFTLVDYVADKRVSTPTGAAEAATPDIRDIYQRIEEGASRLDDAIDEIIDENKEEIESYASRPFFKNPASVYETAIINLNNTNKSLGMLMANKIQRLNDAIVSYKARLEAVNPLAVLKRGYSLVYDNNGQAIKSIKQVNKGDQYSIKVADGTIIGEVIDKKGE